MFSNTAQLFETKTNYDVIFEVCGKEIKAHRQILALKSDVFYLQFFNPIWSKQDKNGKTVIKIMDPNIEVENFEDFIKYFYINKIQFSGDNVFGILYLGNIYNVQNLVIEAEKFIWKNLAEENLIDVANSASFVNSQVLVQKCVQKIVKHRFLNPNFFNLLDKSIIIEVLKKNNKWQMITADISIENDEERVLNIEVELFHLIVGWGNHQLEKKNMENNRENLRKILEDVLPFIRFPLIPGNVFHNQVWSTGLLSTETYEQIMQIKKSGKEHEFPFSNIPRTGSLIYMAIDY
uniref:BTB domain-containing protein n=1 Tax=Panagrolaimus sp. JU765 TaxID=591449 RepID=A0AC34QGW6_9BILA